MDLKHDGQSHPPTALRIVRMASAPSRVRVVGVADGGGPSELSPLFNETAAMLSARFGGGCTIRVRYAPGGLPAVATDHVEAEQRAWLRWLHTRCRTSFDDAFGVEMLRTGETIAMPRVTSKTLRLWAHPGLHPYLERFEVQSVLLVPLRLHARLFGRVAVWREHPCLALDERDAFFLEEFARGVCARIVPIVTHA